MTKAISKTLAIMMAFSISFAMTGCSSHGTDDKSVCSQLVDVFAPMNDGSAPNIAKFENAWPQIQHLVSQAEDKELKRSLASLADTMETFARRVKAEGGAPSMLVSMQQDMQDTYYACETVLKK